MMWNTALTLLVVGALVYGMIRASAFMLGDEEDEE